MKIVYFFCFLFLFNISNLFAEIDKLPSAELVEFSPNTSMTLKPLHLQSEIKVDGILDEAWKQQITFGNFTEYQPSEYKKPNVPTKGYLAYDEKNIYVAFLCNDPNINQLRATLTDRDNIYEDDWVCVSINPHGDNQVAYQFYANAKGIQGDRLWQANGNEDESFDLIWYSDAKIYDDHWAVEIQIPFESLRFPNSEEQLWSVHFTRNFPRENEYRFSWMPISQNNNSFMGQAGNLQFKLPSQNKTGNHIELLPYIIATQSSARQPSVNTLGKWQHNDPETRTGFGLKYGLNSNTMLDFTYNPDFSQIESDAGQINVNNPFALFFSERRPFFQEGADIYTVDRNSTGVAIDQFVNLFYSRSINDPQVAGKLSSRFGRFSLGYTSALDRNTTFVVPFEERSAVFATDKNSINNILRLKYDLGNESSLGFILTDRHLETSGSNSVGAVDASFRLSEKYNLSTIAGLTYTEEPDDKNLSNMISNSSFITAGKEKTSDFDGESFYGKLFRAKLNRNSRHWVATLSYQDFSPGFRADNGFIQSNSFRAAEYVGAYYFRFENNPLFTYIRPRMSMWRKYNYDGVVKDTGLRTSILFNFRKQTVLNISAFIYNRENLYDHQFGDARLIWFYLQNNMHKNISGFIFSQIGKQINRLGVAGDQNNPFDTVPSYTFNFGLTFKPFARFTNNLEFRNFKMWCENSKKTIRGQNIIRNALSYQFNRNMFIRLIGEYNIVSYYNSGRLAVVKQKYFTLDPMFSYKLNAFSVFYLGGRIGAQNNNYLNWQDLRRTNQSFFIKFQYLFSS